jgi:hypothetical protein
MEEEYETRAEVEDLVNDFDIKDIEKIYKADEKVKDAIDKYYVDKNEYYQKVKQIKDNILNNVNIKNQYPNCIFCQRPVGMIFSNEINKNGNKILSAVCGDQLNPCKDKIKIHTGKMTSFMNQIKKYEEMLKQLKIKVILFKNNILFGYLTETNIKLKFEDLKFRIDKCSLELQIIKELYLKNVDKFEDYEELCKLEQQQYGYIEDIKNRIHNYKIDITHTSEKTDDLDELMDIYIRTFIPLLKNLMKLRYSISQVDYDPDGNDFRLIQIKQQYDIGENEYSELPIELISNATATILRKSKKPKEPRDIHSRTLKKHKSLKDKNDDAAIKKKTKQKAKPKKLIVDDDEDENDDEDLDIKNITTKKKLIIDDDDDDLEEFIPIVPPIDEPVGIYLGFEEQKGEIENIPEDIIASPISIMKHDIKQKVIHSDINVDEMKLVKDIPQLVERGNLFNERIVFRCSSISKTDPPGEGEGEEIPEEDKDEFKELSRIKEWRKKIANFWTGSGDWAADFTLDGKRWKSVEHYYQASKFKYGNPDFYEKFSLDYKGDSVEGHPELIIAEKPSLAKHAGTDGLYDGIRVRPEGIEIDEDFFGKDGESRNEYELFIAQKAKFTTNRKLRTLLLATKDAKLTHSYKAVDTNMRIIEPYYFLIYIRHLLQKATV